jgi:hypothetical protein
LRNEVVAGVLVLALIVGAGAGYLAGISEGRTATVRTSTANTSPTQATCTVTAPTYGVKLRVVANNGSWEGVRVGGEAVGYCNDQKQVTMLGPVTTNSSGWASLREYGLSGITYLDVNDRDWVYNLSIVTQPTATTYVTLDLSSGNVTTHFCYGCS